MPTISVVANLIVIRRKPQSLLLTLRKTVARTKIATKKVQNGQAFTLPWLSSSLSSPAPIFVFALERSNLLSDAVLAAACPFSVSLTLSWSFTLLSTDSAPGASFVPWARSQPTTRVPTWIQFRVTTGPTRRMARWSSLFGSFNLSSAVVAASWESTSQWSHQLTSHAND